MISATLASLVLSAASTLGGNGFALTFTAPEKVAIGESAKLVVAVKNSGDKVVVREPMLDARSFEFEVKCGDGRASKYTAYHPASYQPSTLKGQDLAQGGTLTFEHALVIPTAGSWTFTPVWNGGDAPLRGEPKTIVVEAKDGMDTLLWHMETKSGVMEAEFWTDVAPATGLHIANLVARGYYDGLKFHRVMKGFMIQGGDPKGDGSGGPGYSVEAEFNDRKHEPGVLSTARIGDPRERLGARPEAKFANSGGSQFFLCHGDASFLDGKYTAYGRVVKGMEVVDAIASAPVGPNPMSGEPSAPIDPIKIDKATLVPGKRAVAASTAPTEPAKKDGGR